MADKIAPVSLGQGQGPKASLLITDAMATGKSRLYHDALFRFTFFGYISFDLLLIR